MKNKQLSAIIAFCIFFTADLFSQSTIANSESTIWDWMLNNIFLVLGIAVLIGGLFAIMRLSLGLLELQKLRILQEMGADPATIAEEQRNPIENIFSKLWGMIPISKEADLDMGHDYDGIRELDNSLPPWWLYLFYGTIIFAVVYMYQYESPYSDWSSEQEYAMEMKKAEEIKMIYLDKMANDISEKTVTVLTDEAALEEGKNIYIGKCAVCHGQLGEGLVGPNFADAYWVNGGSINDIFKTIKYGVPDKGMISWQQQLRPAAMQKVSSYILTLQGTDPPNQKAKEGILYEAEKLEE